jgi:hypothetical protein
MISRRIDHLFAAVTAFAVTVSVCGAADDEQRAQIVGRVTHDIEYLASDELGGRGVGTPGIELAADHIIQVYEAAGLKPAMPDGGWKQAFEIEMGDVQIGDETALALVSPDGTTLELVAGEQFQPLRRGTDSGSAAAGLVFIGYGISSTEDSFDDYAGVDVKDRIVVMIRREPVTPVDGLFRGPETSSHSYIDRKLELAQKAGAVGILFVNNAAEDPDALVDPSAFGVQSAGIPFLQIRQSVVDQLLKATPLSVDDGAAKFKSFAEVSQSVDSNLKPVSQPLQGWKAEMNSSFKVQSVTAHNIVGMIQGTGPTADEIVVIGGHYDQLGLGGYGSRAQNRFGEVHNGADDNASGTAAVLELARRIAAGPAPSRTLVFACFSGEERGLLGSYHYVKNPLFPLEQTVAMINFDMIGNLRENRVEVTGTGTADQFEQIAKEADEAVSVDTTLKPGAFGGSDHLPFYQRQIPVLCCFTGMTSIYHTPDDDASTLNMEGAVLVIDYAEQLLRGVDALESRPVWSSQQPGRRRPARTAYLGFQPDLGASTADGILVRAVRAKSPAEQAGLMTGDIISAVDGSPVEGYQSIVDALGQAKAGDTMKLAIRRGDDELTLDVKLGTSP